MTSTKWTILSGSFWNWACYVANILVMFVFSPYFISKMGDTRYGFWNIAISLTGYYSLLDVGIRNSLVRYVAKHHAANEPEELNDVVNSCYFIFTVVGFIVLLAALTIAAILPSMFEIESSFLFEARWTVLITGLGLAVKFPLNALSGILVGLQRYELTAKINLLLTIVFFLVNMLLLWAGFGLIAIAITGAISGVLSLGIMAVLGVRMLPELKIDLHVPSRAVLQKIFSYSIYIFIIGLAGRFFSYTTPMVIGVTISLASVALFSIPAALITYAVDLISNFSRVLQPYASATQAKGDMDELSSMTLWCVRLGITLYMPLCIIILCFGADFIRIWVGGQYVDAARDILWILAVSNIFLVAEMSLENILTGMGYVKFLASVLLAEAVISIVLIITLIPFMGLTGAAVGIAVPQIVNRGIIIPMWGVNKLRFNYSTFIMNGVIKPSLIGAPLYLFGTVIRIFLPPVNYPGLVVNCLAVFSIYFLLIFMCSSEINKIVRQYFERYFVKA